MPEDEIEQFLPDGFEPAQIFMGGPYPNGTTGLYLYAVRYANGSLDDAPLEAGHLTYWGLHVTPPPEHEGDRFHFLQVSAYADDPLVLDALQAWGVPDAEAASIWLTEGLADVLTGPHWTHNALTVDSHDLHFTIQFAVHGLAECTGGGGCHQSRTPVRMFGVEDRQVTGYVDVQFDPSNVFILGGSQVTYGASPPPSPYPWPGTGIAGRFAGGAQTFAFNYTPVAELP